MTRAGAAVLSLLVAASCSKDSAKKPQPEPKQPVPEAARPAPTGDIAVVNVEGQLLAVSMNGSTKPYVKSGAGWCATDNRSQVIWYTADEQLRYIDLEDGASHVALEGIGEFPDIILDYGDEQIGGHDEVEPIVALHVQLSDKPTIAAKILCAGDGWFSCYEPDEDDDIENNKLNPELEAQRKRYDALKPADAPALAALHARGKARTLSLEAPKVEQPAALTNDAFACEFPEDCGSVQVLPSTPPIWIVIVGNSQGDYYHEDYRLYDPSSKEFFSAEDPAKRSPNPPKDETLGMSIEGMLVAPSGKAYIMRDVIATWEKVVWHVEDAGACGWIGPSYRIGGPRG